MAEFPALTLWTDSYLADTRMLSTMEHGAYLLLLMEAWRRPHCDLPDDDKILARLAGLSRDEWDEIKPTIMGFWTYDGRSKTWHQKRLRKERDAARVRSKSAKDKAAKRWNKAKNHDAGALPNECPEDASTATATAIITEEEPDGSSHAQPDQRQQVIECWNVMAKAHGLSICRLTDKRRKSLNARLKADGFDAIQQAIERIPKSSFLLGIKPGSDWQADIEFLLRPDSVTKILEGKYDDRTTAPSRNSGDEFSRAARRWANLGDAEEPSGGAHGRAVQSGEGYRQGALALPEAGHG